VTLRRVSYQNKSPTAPRSGPGCDTARLSSQVFVQEAGSRSRTSGVLELYMDGNATYQDFEEITVALRLDSSSSSAPRGRPRQNSPDKPAYRQVGFNSRCDRKGGQELVLEV
jgi:hypothetical protein